MRWLMVACSLVTAVGTSALAKELPSAFKCRFATGYFSAPEGGTFETKPAGKMEFTIAAINADQGSAQMVGNMGATPLAILRGGYTLNFLEQTPVGNINLTTVYTASDAEGRFYAVHSRHIGTAEDAMVSQYLGSCQGLWP